MITSGYMPSNRLFSHMIFSFLIFKGISIQFSAVAISLYIPTSSVRGLPFLQHLILFLHEAAVDGRLAAPLLWHCTSLQLPWEGSWKGLSFSFNIYKEMATPFSPRPLFQYFYNMAKLKLCLKGSSYEQRIFSGGSDGKGSACNVGDLGSIPGSWRALGKGMATHSSMLAWRIPWTGETGG